MKLLEIHHLDLWIIIAMAVIIIISYFFNILAKKTNVPSVLMLLALGIGLKYGLDFLGFGDVQQIIEAYQILPIIGTIGLILIVLEAALDLKLSKEKWPVIWRSFMVALLCLIGSALGIAYVFDVFIFNDFLQALIYAIPLSIMSSAIIIPSVGGLETENKEFMIYESTFSDILGIMFFFFVLKNLDATSTMGVIKSVSLDILKLTVLSVITSFFLVWLFQKITSNIKLFLIIAILMLLYAIGKFNGDSALVLILVFGLMLNNHKLFFVKGLRKFVDDAKLKPLLHDFHILSLESAFVIRTFFFVIFGITITLSSLLNLKMVMLSVIVVTLMILVRFLVIKIFKAKSMDPLLLLNPRGLITILLFFAIPAANATDKFDPGILLFAIISTGLLMTYALVTTTKVEEPKLEHAMVGETQNLEGRDASPTVEEESAEQQIETTDLTTERRQEIDTEPKIDPKKSDSDATENGA